MIELYFQVFPNLQLCTRYPMYRFDEHKSNALIMNSCKACFSHTCCICLKEKRSVPSFDNCYRKLLVRSKAEQSGIWIYIRAWEPPTAAWSQPGDPSGWGFIWSCEVGFSGSKKYFLTEGSRKSLKYSQYCLSVCYVCFQTWFLFFFLN